LAGLSGAAVRGARRNGGSPSGNHAPMRYAVAASGSWVDLDGIRRPAGEVHVWWPGANQTLCGLALSRTRLARLPHVDWADVRPESGRHADEVRRVCPRCDAGTGRRPDGSIRGRRAPRPRRR
jgi:hypothetical protein